MGLLTILGNVDSATTKMLEMKMEAEGLGGYLWESLKRLRDRRLADNVIRKRPRKVNGALIQEDFIDKELHQITDHGRAVLKESGAATRSVKKGQSSSTP